MKIAFTQTGGIMGRSKTGVVDYQMDEAEWDELISHLKMGEPNKSGLRDGLAFYLRKDGETKKTRISISNIPGKWTRLFDELYSKLKYDAE